MGDRVCAIRSTSHDGGGFPGTVLRDALGMWFHSQLTVIQVGATNEGGCAALPPSPLMQSHHLPLSAPSSDRPWTHSS